MRSVTLRLCSEASKRMWCHAAECPTTDCGAFSGLLEKIADRCSTACSRHPCTCKGILVACIACLKWRFRSYRGPSTLHRLLDRTQTVRARAVTCVQCFVDSAPRNVDDGSAASAARQSLGTALLHNSQQVLRVNEHKQRDEVIFNQLLQYACIAAPFIGHI